MRLDAGRERDTVFSELASTSGGLSNGSGWQRLSLCRPQQVTLTLEKVSYDTLAAARGYDLEAEDDGATRVSYALVRGVFPFKPRDTVTRVAERPGQRWRTLGCYQ